MSRTLHPHQVKAIDGLRSSLKAGFRRPLLFLPTGAGKTRCAGEIVKGARTKGKRVLFVVPAISLIDQTVRSFWAEGITDIGVIQGNHPMTRPEAPVQVASIQTLQRRSIPPFDIVVVDECFAAGTLIKTPKGPVPIEQIQSGDLVFNAIGIGVVEGIVCQQKQTITLELSDGTSIVCTHDHPFFCPRGWVAAGDLEVGSGLFSHEDLRRLWSGGASLGLESGSSDGRGAVRSSEVLLRILREEAREPDAGYCGPAEDVRNASTDRAHAEGAWWQWQADPIASDEAARSAGRRVADRVRDEDRREARPEPTAVLLQDRHCEPLANDRNRSGREHSSRGTGEAEGQRQGDVPCSVRVVSISREERGGPEAVYNLRVSGHPSYFAGGVLVHNCHRWFEMLGQWMAAEAWKNIPFVGLSATPWTKGLGKHYDDLIQVTTTAELIEAGYLSPFRVYAPSHPDLGGVRTVAGDYHEGDLSEAMNKPALVADVVTTWRQRGENRPTFVFAVDRAHANHLQGEFEKAGIGCGYIDAFTKPDEREAMFKRFSAGELRVIASVGCLTTGVDLDVRCIVLARPTRSEMLYVQIIGRGLRMPPPHPVFGVKDTCLVLDHSDTTLRLGFVTDIHHDALDDGRERQKSEARQKPEALPKECSACNFLKPAKTPKCPACGFKPERQSEIQCEDGELVEMTPVRKKANADEKAFVFGQLKAYARSKGHKPGWAANKFRERFDVWPNAYRNAPEIEPTAETLGWIKSRQIAFANRRKEPAYAAAAE
ncbi:superfamily II DNA or RNA helicase [Methylorubrum extorquens]|nr:DEAD/DEAH box helicase family protein [Methylorubrum extorquens]MCP1545328.1 superfamily II DNA or RNA helicase [Methylorubrum extorquens]MCP1587325.1 superfamily II DNA or RNA helicase [Methylorubrum extorquens]